MEERHAHFLSPGRKERESSGLSTTHMTPHNQANPGEIAKIVLMPGDPLRAKFLAENFLENPVQFNSVRNMFGYTGIWKGQRVSVMGSGMGMPSIGIYSYELFSQYGVDAIIRIGSAGGYTGDLHLFDVVMVKDAWSESSYAKIQSEDMDDVQTPSPELNALIEKTAKEDGIKLNTARIHSSDVFYHEDGKAQQAAIDHGAAAVEMESFALFHNAKVLHKQAACLLTISDSFAYPDEIATPRERETSMTTMLRLALDTAAAWCEDHK